MDILFHELNFSKVNHENIPEPQPGGRGGTNVSFTRELAMYKLTQKLVQRLQYAFIIALGVLQLGFAPNLTVAQKEANELPTETMNYWGYQKLQKQIGVEETKVVAKMIEDSEYPDLIRAIITTESSWNTKAESYADARGLMQIRQIAAQEVDPTVEPEDLFDPFTNVEIGIAIFKDHMQYFANYSGSEHWALTSYNRGRYGTFSLKQHPPRTRYSKKVLGLTETM